MRIWKIRMYCLKIIIGNTYLVEISSQNQHPGRLDTGYWVLIYWNQYTVFFFFIYVVDDKHMSLISSDKDDNIAWGLIWVRILLSKISFFNSSLSENIILLFKVNGLCNYVAIQTLLSDNAFLKYFFSHGFNIYQLKWI